MDSECAKAATTIDSDEESSIEEVRLTVSTSDVPSLPVWTFRMWFLGILSCVILSFLNTFFSYRTEPLIISMISVQVATLPIGRFMAAVLPGKKFSVLGLEFSLNPGPFNMKEHVLISIFANAGSAFGSGSAYDVSIVDIIRAFYHRKISFMASWILVITTQVLGYGWAGVLRKYVVEPAQMWWPRSLVQVSLFRALHETDASSRMSRAKFFTIALVCSFTWYIIPGYLFPTLSNLSVLCLVFSKSVTAQQIGSGMRGLGLLSFTVDWSVIASYMGSPLVTPFFAIVNVYIGFVMVMYVLIPITYWGFDMYNAKTFPIFSSHLFDRRGQIYDVSAIVNKDFEIDMPQYEKQGQIRMSTFFALTYGIGFAAVISTITHVILFKGSFTFPISVITATTNQFIGTIIAGTINISVAWWLLTSIENICQDQLLPPDSPWTCSGDRVFYDASVIWGLVGPKRIFGSLGPYSSLNWFFMGGFLGPLVVYLFHKAFPNQKWIQLINLPVILGSCAAMPPATTLNFNSWVFVGTIFNFFVLKYRKRWWQKYNYVLSAALDAGLAFMGILLYFSLTMSG
ncbi:hypothetical protein L1987_43313 [Smallanthus sonchifolius]|uniref:Uncharacterized protein n=1 Tax=Smallanthus sonchifolius TaxID=185202 RepID=A0ACB9GMC4_9ASTR|nr:hypothetical protein L1987_43313 [Smallanthus sonchifolius]